MHKHIVGVTFPSLVVL